MDLNLSIIIVTYNTCDLTVRCLDAIDHSLDATHIRAEVILIDNKSEDASRTVLPSYKSKNFILRYFYSEENLGFGRGNNFGVQHASSAKLLFINTDCFVGEHTIKILMDEQKKYNADFIGPRLRNTDLSAQPSCGPLMDLPAVLLMLFAKGDSYGITRSSPHEPTQVGWVSGACFLCDASTYQKLNGFDTNIFMYMEEIELFTRSRAQHMTVWYTPKAECVHIGSASSNKTFPVLQIYKGLLYLHATHSSRFVFTCVKYALVLKAYIAILFGHSHYREALLIVKNYAHPS